MLLESMLATMWDSSPAQLLRATFILNTWPAAIDHTHQPHPIRVHTTPGHTHVLWERCLVATISISLFMRGVTDSWRVRLSEEDKTEDKYTVRTCMLHILVQKSTFLISITTSTFYTVHVVSGTREQIHISPASVQYTVDTCMYMLSH